MLTDGGDFLIMMNAVVMSVVMFGIYMGSKMNLTQEYYQGYVWSRWTGEIPGHGSI